MRATELGTTRGIDLRLSALAEERIDGHCARGETLIEDCGAANKAA